MAPSHSIFIRSDGAVNACCVALWQDKEAMLDSQIHRETVSLEEHFSKNITIEKIKKSLEQGIFPDECKHCQQYEKKEVRSLRQGLEQKYGKPTADSTLRHLNLEIGNVCNLRCLYCGPIFSSSWNSEIEIQKKHSLSDGYQPSSDWLENPELISFLVEKISYSQSKIVEIEIVGGEPFLNPFHDKFLNAILDNNLENSVSLLYSSNFTVIKDHQIELLKRFPKSELLLSIDSLDPYRFNYIRHPADLHNVLRNFEKVRKEGVFVRPFVTILALNIQDLPELLSWSIGMGIPPAFNFVDQPNFFHVSVASERRRELVIRELEKLNFSRREQLLNTLKGKQDSEGLLKLKAYLTDLDNTRGNNFEELFAFE